MTLYYETEVCDRFGIDPVAATLAEYLLKQYVRGLKLSKKEIAMNTRLKPSQVTSALKELESVGLLNPNTGDLNAYLEFVEEKDELPDIPIIEVFKATIEAFNNLHEEDPDMPTYTERNKTVLGYVKDLAKHPMADVPVKDNDKFTSLKLRIQGVIAHKWVTSKDSDKWKVFVRPDTLLRSPQKFYDRYLVEARNYHLKKK